MSARGLARRPGSACLLGVLGTVACATPAPPSTHPAPSFEAVELAASNDPSRDYDNLIARLGSGVCVLDADGSPPLDLFLPGRAGSSRLLYARGALAYEEVAIDAGDAIGCLAFDADADGDTDLLATGPGTIRLLLRDADGFIDGADVLTAAADPAHVYASAAAGDVDHDGDVDLVVAGFVDASHAPTGTCDGLPCAVLISELPGLPNRVFLRDAGGLREVADPGPLGVAEPTLVVGVTDVDGDDDAEVYVGNDAGDLVQDRVVRFVAGRWEDVAERTGMAYDGGGHGIDTMGWTVGDVDGDLRMDFAVGAFEGFHSPVFLCGDDGWCVDEGRRLGTWRLADSFRWGVALADLDLDGDLDLFEVCGHVFTEPEAAAAGFEVRHAQPPNVALNDGGSLTAAALSLPAMAGRGLSVADLDDDGRLDVVVTASRGPVTLLRGRASGHALRVSLVGPAENPDGIGATVEVRSRGRRFVRRRVAGEGFLGSFDPRLHFGLPDGPARVEVRWPDGEVSLVEAAAGDRLRVEHPRRL